MARKWWSGAVQHRGPRNVQEDTALIGRLDTGFPAFVVCDGVGGQEGGEGAARAAATVFLHELSKWHQPGADLSNPHGLLHTALVRARTALPERGNTTLTGGWIDVETYKAHIIHVGDCTAYVQVDEPVRVTRPHHLVVLPNVLLASVRHPEAVDMLSLQLTPGTVLYVTSDGLDDVQPRELMTVCPGGREMPWDNRQAAMQAWIDARADRFTDNASLIMVGL